MKSILLLTAFSTTLSDGLEFLLESFLVFPSVDVVPNAVNWLNITSTVGGPYNSTAQKITGVSQSIVLRITYTGTMTLAYKTSSDSIQVNYGLTPTGWTTITSGNTFTVLPEYHVGFVRLGTRVSVETVTVQNNSDGNAVLDTFTATMNSIE